MSADNMDNERTFDEAKRSFFVEGGQSWWRASDYEVRDGLIRPIAGATVEEYDPWAEFWGAQAQTRGHQLRQEPLVSLVQLAKEENVEAWWWGKAELSRKTEAAMLSWVRSHGLLGLMLHMTVEVQAGERTVFVNGSSSENTVPVYGHQTRRFGTKRPPGRNVFHVGWFSLRDGRFQSVPVSEYQPKPAEAVVRESPRSRLITVPLEDAWGPFLPDYTPESIRELRIPEPSSPEFWLHYCEPVMAFFWAVRALRMTLAGLSIPNDEGESMEYESSREAATRFLRALDELNELLEGTRPMLATPEAGDFFRLQWSSPSLLSTLALQAVWALAGGAVPRVCGACGTPFLTRAYQGLYCSDQCRWRAQKRRQRKRNE